MKSPEWEQFERAVARFVEAVDKNAVVRHDVVLPDKDSGEPRQRDVWVEAQLCGLFPVKILISCKAWKRKLDSSHIDSFIGELSASGADIGAIYSRSGFTQPALKKARVRGVHCCLLYSNEPAELPPLLSFATFCCHPRVRLRLTPKEALDPEIETWGEVFELPYDQGAKDRTVLEELVCQYAENEQRVTKDLDPGLLPKDWSLSVLVSDHKQPERKFVLTVETTWRLFQGNVEAHLVDGTYNATHETLIGKQTTPWIDLENPPGEQWVELSERPAEVSNRITAILAGGDLGKNLREALGNAALV